MADASRIDDVINRIVDLMSTNMVYRVGISDAGQNKPDEEMLRRGEQATNIVRTSVSQYGNQDEKDSLANFEREPQRYQRDISGVLTDIATRTLVFMQELQSLIKQFEDESGSPLRRLRS
jgi:hypothetical protein